MTQLKKLLPILISMLFLTGCAVVELTGDAIGLAGTVAITTIKVTGAVAKGTGSVVRTFKGTISIPLEREGNSYYVKVKVNKKKKARLLLDTGASSTQLSESFARKSGIKYTKGKMIKCTLADNSTVYAYSVKARTIQVGKAKVKNCTVVVLPGSVSENNCDGLLGMSFLGNYQFRIDPVANALYLKEAK